MQGKIIKTVYFSPYRINNIYLDPYSFKIFNTNDIFFKSFNMFPLPHVVTKRILVFF